MWGLCKLQFAASYLEQKKTTDQEEATRMKKKMKKKQQLEKIDAGKSCWKKKAKNKLEKKVMNERTQGKEEEDKE